MGRYMTHVGPYVVVSNLPTEDVSDGIRYSCSNLNCTQFVATWRHSVKFCNECGSAVRTRAMTRTRLKTVSEIIDDDVLVPISNGVHIPNHHYSERCFDPSRDDGEFSTNLTATNIKAETKWFNDRYAEALAELRKVCGSKNVLVQWGVVYYY